MDFLTQIHPALADPLVLAAIGGGLFIIAIILTLVGRSSSKVTSSDALQEATFDFDGTGSSQTLRERLIAADFGPGGVNELIEHLDANKQNTDDPQALRTAVVDYYRSQVHTKTTDLAHKRTDGPIVWVMVGVNGSGKTTTTAKLAQKLQQAGHTVAVGACDTFRAAAETQLAQWSERVGFRLVQGREGSDPASVAHNAVTSAMAQGESFVLLDTAGRLQADSNLMRELEKIYRVCAKALGRDPDETWLVVDATQGQNIRSQANLFGDVVPLSGLILTKYDGVAMGGAALDCSSETTPIGFVGVGEGADDLMNADPELLLQRVFGQ